MKHITAALILLLSAAVAAAEDPKPFAGGSGTFTKLVWADEFDYTGLPNPEKWSYEEGYCRNQELQYYTKERLENAEVKDGNLVITARNEQFKVDVKGFEKGISAISSASLHTRGKGFWDSGRIEVRAKLPLCLGTWPAVWMMPNDNRGKGWPHCGEIDIMEHVGWSPDTVHITVHTSASKKGPPYSGTTTKCTTVNTEYHVYAVEWFKDRMDFYFDDQKKYTYSNEGIGDEQYPYDKPFYLILNLAFGGAWGDDRGIDQSKLPQSYYIDYVRVWQEK
ncbi:MAG: glycoside hydrolase family 16 protein [Planctomycetaceae bacterium]|jgi:beta-glucanase (GH16 family)|nr:glycoside hydrolase family 16 protein [Planctomycetaceae bacterium]